MSEPPQTVKSYRGRPQQARKARLKVDFWCELLGANDRAVGHIRNLTVGGCRVLSPSAFPIRDTISLILAGPTTEPDLHLKAELRWLALNPVEGPFELGFRFVHSGDSAEQVERMLKGVMKRTPAVTERGTPSYVRFTGGLEPVRAPGAPTAGELRRVFAAEGLDRLTRGEPASISKADGGSSIPTSAESPFTPGPSAPLP